MKIKVVVLVLILSVKSLIAFAQDNQSSEDTKTNILDKTSIGLGIGMDHGGLGANILVYPGSNLGLFAGVGYAFAGAGFNGGIKYRVVPTASTASTHFYLTAMYGYNAAIKVVDRNDLSKLFYGPTVGLGVDFGPKKYNNGYFTLGLLVPFRSGEVDDYIDELKTNYNIEFENDLIPIGISFGYRFILK